MSTPPYLDLPEGAAPLRLDTPVGRLAALEAVPAGEPRGTALLVPGYTGSKEDFVALLAPLRAEGWHVVALDLPGQCDSPWSDDGGYALDALGAAVLGAADALGRGRVHLLGHSFGGLVVQAATAARPSALASLTLLCTGAGPLPGPRAALLHQLLPALSGTALPDIWAAVAGMERDGAAVPPSAEVAAFLQRRFCANDPAGLRVCGETLLAAPDHVDAVAAALGGDVPVLVAHGEGDDAWPHAVQRSVAARLDARYEVVAGAAHSPNAERPEATAALLAKHWLAAS